MQQYDKCHTHGFTVAHHCHLLYLTATLSHRFVVSRSRYVSWSLSWHHVDPCQHRTVYDVRMGPVGATHAQEGRDSTAGTTAEGESCNTHTHTDTVSAPRHTS